MQRLDIDQLKPSMVLAVTIKDNAGNILFMKGTQLTEKHLAMLRNRDIKVVAVEGSPIEKEGMEDLRGEIDTRFSTAGSHPVIIKIRDMIKELVA